MNELHGGNVYLHPDCVDFSANLNPIGIPDAIRQAVFKNADLWEHYPDPDCHALCEKLAARHQVQSSHIVCGNGADDLLWRIVQALRPKHALLVIPCFSEYRRALESVGCSVEAFSLTQENGFILPENFLASRHDKLDLIILCSPNNPTGLLIPTALLTEISRICKEKSIYMLTDECFIEFTSQPSEHSALQLLHPYSIVLNAFTKTFAMPGLRLGYAIFGDSVLAGSVRGTGQFWSVSVPAQTAGLAALSDTDFLERTRHTIAKERSFLMEGLQILMPNVIPSDANFILFQSEQSLFYALLDEHILIRSCANFEGLNENYYRIAVRSHPENEQLLAALRRCLSWQNR